MFLEQVILVSTVPIDSSSNGGSSSSSSSYKHVFTKNTHTPPTSAINTGTEVLGQVYQVDLGATEAFGIKVSPFTYKDATIPLNCLTAACNDSYSLSPANQLVAYHTTMSALFVYTPGRDRPVSRSFGHERLQALAVTPNGHFLVAGTQTGSLVVWKMSTGDLVGIVEAAHFQDIKVIRFAPDGQTLVTGSADALVKVWSWSDILLSATGTTTTAKPIEALYTFSQHSAPITDLVLSLCTIGNGRGRLVSASLDGKCNYYDLVDGQLLLSLTFPSAITAVAMNAQETLIFAAGIDGNIYPICLNCNSQSSTQQPLQFHSGPIAALKWSLDERVLISAGTEDGQLGFWDPFSLQLIKGTKLSSKKVACTNILVMGKSDPLLSDHQSSFSTNNNNNTSSNSSISFKRIGNPITNLASSAPIILPSPTGNQSGNLDADAKQKINDLVTENNELRLINSELCSIIE